MKVLRVVQAKAYSTFLPYIVKQQTGFQAEIKTYVALVPARIQDRNASSPYAHSKRKKQTR